MLSVAFRTSVTAFTVKLISKESLAFKTVFVFKALTI